LVSPPWEYTSTFCFELEFLANNKITVDSMSSLLTRFSAILLFSLPRNCVGVEGNGIQYEHNSNKIMGQSCQVLDSALHEKP
jgi:hypothetical protein